MIPAITAFFVSVAFWPSIMSAAVAPRWAAVAVGVPISLFYFKKQRQVPGLSVFLFITLILSALPLLWAPDKLAGINILIHLILFSLTIILGTLIEDMSLVAIGVSVGLAVNAVFVILQSFNIEAVAEIASPAGLFFNRNVLVEFAAPVLILVLGKRLHWIYLVGPAICVALAPDRAAIVGLTVAALFYTIKLSTKKTAILGSIIFIVVACIFLIIHTHQSPWGIKSIVDRKTLYEYAFWNLVPWGAGLGAYAANWPTMEFVHFDALQLIYELGIFSVPWFLLLGPLVFLKADEDVEPEHAAFLVILVESLFSFPFQMPATVFLAAVCVGRLCAARHSLRVFGYGGRDRFASLDFGTVYGTSHVD